MSETNRTDLSYIKEASPGVTPPTGNFRKIPYTAAPDFSFNPQTVQSEEIRADRQTDDLALVGIEAGGSIDFEFALNTYNELIAAAFYNDWNEVDSADVSKVTFAANRLTFASAADIPPTFKPGALIKINDHSLNEGVFLLGAITGANIACQGIRAGGSSGENFAIYGVGLETPRANIVENSVNRTLTISNAAVAEMLEAKTLNKGDWIGIQPLGFYRILTKTRSGAVTTLTYDRKIGATQASDWTAAVDAANGRIYFADTISNGAVKQSVSILQRFQSLVGKNQALFSGCFADTLNIAFETQAILSASLGFIAYNSRYLATSIPASRVKEAAEGKILNSSSNIAKLFLGGSEVAGPNYIQGGAFNLNNNSRRQNAVGQIGSVGVAAGACDITGSLSTYFGSTELAEAVVANEEKSFLSFFNDGEGRRFVIDMPRIKFSSGTVNVPARNEDLILPLEYQALREADLGYQAKFSSFRYA